MGLISGIPFLNFVNCCCCAGVLFGGFMAVFFYSKELKAGMAPLESSDGCSWAPWLECLALLSGPC